jgi:hypothetical protein
MKKNEVIKRQSIIDACITEALLLNGDMSEALYEYELKEHVQYWIDGLVHDKNDFVFVVTENREHIAMLLIDKKHKVYINEQARTQLKKYWKRAYDSNMVKLLPEMIDDIANDYFALFGCTFSE